MIEFFVFIIIIIPLIIGYFIGKSIGYNSSLEIIRDREQTIQKLKNDFSNIQSELNNIRAMVNSAKMITDTQTKKTTIYNIDVSAYKENISEKNLEELMKELNSLIGLKKVKDEVNTLINTLKIKKIRESKGMSYTSMSMHLVFSGNPGTGKTTVARILAKIYHKLGFLSKGHLIEVDRSGLVAGYVGQTAIKTQEIIEKAKGGVLFIDEAYSLTSNKSDSDFGNEAVDTLLKYMEDYRNDLIVIVAGYPELMNDFLKSNPGLQSRFNNFIDFEDYNPNELYEIFIGMCNKEKYKIAVDTVDIIKNYFISLYNKRSKNYGNAREVRNIFEMIIKNQSNRLVCDDDLTEDELLTITYEDIKNLL